MSPYDKSTIFGLLLQASYWVLLQSNFFHLLYILQRCYSYQSTYTFQNCRTCPCYSRELKPAPFKWHKIKWNKVDSELWSGWVNCLEYCRAVYIKNLSSRQPLLQVMFGQHKLQSGVCVVIPQSCRMAGTCKVDFGCARWSYETFGCSDSCIFSINYGIMYRLSRTACYESDYK